MRNVTREHHVFAPNSRVAPFIEPFMDGFVRSFLAGLENGAYDGAAAIVFWRQGPGALHAYRYAMELRRLGLLPRGPRLVLWNHVTEDGAAQAMFNARATAQMLAALPEAKGDTVQAPPATPQAIAGKGPRLALAGEPLGNDVVQTVLARQGVLVLDLQADDAPQGDLSSLLAQHRVETLFWQVDVHDDLHGWRMPEIRDTCARVGVRFVDLGFLPRWPALHDVPQVPA
ncbi:MAG: hypothetical protein R3D60_00375 [Paracoccaceae bacterium]